MLQLLHLVHSRSSRFYFRYKFPSFNTTERRMNKFRFAIDRGGTFTDVFALCPNGKVRVLKLLSDDPSNYRDAPREGIRRILAEETGLELSPETPIGTENLEWIRMGTTVATNALLQRKGERIALAVTSGFKDLLHIGNQSRPDIFSLKIECPDVLYEDVIEVEERVVLQQSKCQIKKPSDIRKGVTNENLEIWKPLDTEKLKYDLAKVLLKGIKCLAVVLTHSHIFVDHEVKVGEIAKEMGFQHISLSCEVMPMIKMVPRGHTTCVDAYLTPIIKNYVENFCSGFDKNLEGVNLHFMKSDGGLTHMSRFCGSHAILSGPAGGVVGYTVTTYDKCDKSPIIGFDMGGTSTDVSRYDGSFEHVYDTTIAGVNVQAPQLNITTVAAGGGSKLFFRSGLMVVGPESAGAHPGPLCYRKGGPLTVTDANLCLGRIQAKYFPKIFGKSKDMPLDKDSVIMEFKKLTEEVNNFLMQQGEKELYTAEKLAHGFIMVANESMCRPIRALTQGKGFNTYDHVLACFGGAGSQHACAIAKTLGISTIYIHKYAGILSAYGIALADVVEECQESCALEFVPETFKAIDSRIEALSEKGSIKLQDQGFEKSQIMFETYLNMRYLGTDHGLMCSSGNFQSTLTKCSNFDFKENFVQRHKREFGFAMPDRKIIIDDIRIRAVAQHGIAFDDNIPEATGPPLHVDVVQCYLDGDYHDTNVYLLKDLLCGHNIPGPSMIIDVNCTILVELGCIATITNDGSIKIEVKSDSIQRIGTEFDIIQLSVFSHRFMSIAEQMGKVLQRTSVSTNIKERLDFSCALFGPDGGLVSNAPHIPVHLGSMQNAVQFQMISKAYLGDNKKIGNVILTNHPCAGGTHLPDLTVITPVFHEREEFPVFFVASRGHHAEIGGLTPGSMPPHSTQLLEEGATFISFKLVKNGIFQEEELANAFQVPAQVIGCSGTRNLKDNISDLKAQVAANQKGITLVQELIEAYGLDVVQSYMNYIQKTAEHSVRNILKHVGLKQKVLEACDYMDDGTAIQLKITINSSEGSAIFDFCGTGYEVYGNCNAPRAITMSAIIYCFRCMIEHDVPLNQGFLTPVDVRIPNGSILCPSRSAAVVGGNVLTSQRVVDVIFKAFGTCAASQGCMNNITFGDDEVSYYETVAGGAGAGPTWHGRSGVHTHMTNTRITDVEIFERRFPVVVKKFQLNHGTGGKGQYKGGDGIIREILFRKNLTLSILTERRVIAPYGLQGGDDGKKGLNLLEYKDGRIINLGGKKSVPVSAGDVLLLHTPGGGGYGKSEDVEDS